MNILGLSAFYHDSACCLLQNGKLTAAVSEERFSRIKHDAGIPTQAFQYCLAQANLTPEDLDCIAYYESPVNKVARQLAFASQLENKNELTWIDPGLPNQMIRDRFGYDGEILFFDHHLSHAASAYYYSGFQDAAIFTVDGVGEWATTGYGIGHENQISLFETVDFPHSLGLLFATITSFLGFRVNGGEYKVMGLASYGKPTYLDQISKLIDIKSKGQFRLNLRYFDYLAGMKMYSNQMVDLFRLDPRKPETEITQDHKNLAKSLQVIIEEILLKKTTYLREVTGKENLVMAGGVALNAVANRRIRRESGFQDLFIQPAAGDAGGCLGAAALAHFQLTGERHSNERISHLYLGPDYSNDEIKNLLRSTGIKVKDFSGKGDKLIKVTAEKLYAGEIIGWFQGRMEFGPRALGNRSILANPLRPEIQDQINTAVKKRETFRPFAPVVLFPHHENYFSISHHAPFMIEICDVKPQTPLPGITHIDGTARPQTLRKEENPRLAKLLEAFCKLSGVPILVNTSFNQRGEPIVCSPVDALFCMGTSLLDVLVIEDCMIERKDLPKNWTEILEAWDNETKHLRSSEASELVNLYTFF